MSITPDFNKYPKIANFDEVIFIAQQAYELGFRGGTGEELYAWLKSRLDLTGLSNTAGLPEDFPAPGSTLSATNKGEWTILTPGTYNKATSGTIVVEEGNIAFAQYDGEDYNLVRVVEMPEPEANGFIKKDDNRAVSGDLVHNVLSETTVIGSLKTPFVLKPGQINATTGSPNSSVNWLVTDLLRYTGGTIYISGFAKPTGDSNPEGWGGRRVATYDESGSLLGFVASDKNAEEISFLPDNNVAYFRVQVAAGIDIGSPENISTSIYWSRMKIHMSDGEIIEPALKAEKIRGNIQTKQIRDIEEISDKLKPFLRDVEFNKPITLTSGYITPAGNTTSVSGFFRTSVTAVNSMAKYERTGIVLYSGSVDSGVDMVAVSFYDADLIRVGWVQLPEGIYDRHNLGIPPEGTVYIATCSYQIEPEIHVVETEFVPTAMTGSVLYVDSKTGDDTNTGSPSRPFKSISKAISVLSDFTDGEIIVSSGTYREVLDFASLKSGNFSIKNREGHEVRVLGSDEISDFTKTEGFSNVYEAEFHGTIPNWSRADNPIFEDGRPSMEIDFSERHPLHKNLKYRLPFSPIYSKNNLNEVENTPGSYFHDASAGIIYIHTTDSVSPLTSGFKYEVIQRKANTFNDASTTDKNVTLYIEGLQFLYHTLGVVSRGFKKAHFVNCVSLASIGAGAFRPDTGLNIFEYCEAGFCNNDGFNGHFSGYSGYQSLTDNRSNYPTTHYIACWGHDNFDDGESSHEHHNVYMSNCLLEYNTKSGCMPSNDATYLIDDTVFRFNSGRNFDLSVTGYGLASVNPPSGENRIGVSVQATNCISYGNDYGYGILSSDTNKLHLSNCVSRNNLLGEYRPNKGKMILDNCKASNPDSNKIIIEDGTGTVEIISDDVI